MDLPLYTTVPSSELSDLGSANYHMFDRAVTLDQVMRQSGQDDDQKLFRGLLLRLRNGESTLDDWRHLMRRTPAEVGDTTPFDDALHLYPTVLAVSEHNVSKLRASVQAIANIKAVHAGPGAAKASVDDAGGLEPIVNLAHGARVMLTANLWVEVGLVNGAVGTVVAICYGEGRSPPELPIAVTVKFDSYTGPTLSDGTVPIIPLRRTWFSTSQQCSRLQLPLKLAWAVTIHKAQGMTLDKVSVSLGTKEFSSGLTFMACSRVRRLSDLLFEKPFDFQRLTNLSKSNRLKERLQEDVRLLQLSTSPCGQEGGVPGKDAKSGSSRLDPGHPVPRTGSEGGSPNLPGNEAGSGGSRGDVHIENVDPNAYQFRYNPVDADWQQRTCREMRLEYHGPNGVTPGGPDVILTPALTYKRIAGDGNCLFRSFSYIITGSEEQHMLVRHAIIAHMRSLGEYSNFWQVHLSDIHERGLEQYSEETAMEYSGEWGSSVEIIALAHLLNIPVYTYCTGGPSDGWRAYKPGAAYGMLDLSQDDLDSMAMYVHHRYHPHNSHYEVVTAIQ